MVYETIRYHTLFVKCFERDLTSNNNYKFYFNVNFKRYSNLKVKVLV